MATRIQKLSIDTSVLDNHITTVSRNGVEEILISPRTLGKWQRRIDEEFRQKSKDQLEALAVVEPETQEVVNRILKATGLYKRSFTEMLSEYLPLELLKEEVMKSDYFLGKIKK